MFKNYLKTGIRNIKRDGYYSVIKIAGLALGLGTSLVLFLYTSYQLSFDEFHPDVDRLYRVNQTNIWSPSGGVFSSTGPAVAPALAEGYPEFEGVLRINTPGGKTIRYVKSSGEVVAFNEESILAADSNFFSFFAFTLTEGDAGSALLGKDKVVLSDKAARRLFGDAPALGKIIQMGDERTALEVSGVTEEQPLNAHFQFDYLLSMPTNTEVKNMEWSWIWTQMVTYVKVKPMTDVVALQSKFKSAPDQYAPATFKALHMDYNEFVSERGAWELYLQPVRDIHLYSADIGNRLGTVGAIRNVYIFGFVGLFIMLIAIINFVNLSTARAANRAKEVGVKKALGWERRSLIAQFQVEHILVTITSMALGLAVMELLRLVIQPITGITIPMFRWNDPRMLLLLVLTPLVIGFLAGLYPSFYLTSFHAAQVLKGKVTQGLRASGLRNSLVVFQFTISIALMAATVIIFNQLSFFQSKSIGFEKDNLVVLKNAEKLGDQLVSFRDELQKLDGVLDASISTDLRGGFEDIFMREGSTIKLPISQYKADEYFFSTLRLDMAAGRAFDERVSDSQSVVINETTARLFGWSPEEALGKNIIYIGDDVSPSEIIGVARDVHFQSLRQQIEPVIFYHTESRMWGDKRVILVKYESGKASTLINKIQHRWNGLAEASPFEFYFYDEEVKQRYNQELRLGSLFTIFTGLSITIAVIGLVGLVSYSAEQRKKEIGIRKVFGASLTRIYIMMNSQYIKLIFIAVLIATPLTWWFMQQWLNSYSYKIEINVLIFIGAGMIELLFALTCVGYLALRAASLNPTDVLKEQ
ncbi:MAG TPA: ABC transporter permease [Ohtaekwangia sp.]|nr:ABC transporter permease [Ohtaekwangia sp.]